MANLFPNRSLLRIYLPSRSQPESPQVGNPVVLVAQAHGIEHERMHLGLVIGLGEPA